MHRSTEKKRHHGDSDEDDEEKKHLAQLQQKLGYTDEDNPFGDSNLANLSYGRRKKR